MVEQPTNILVVGADGQLGRALCAREWSDSLKVRCCRRSDLDITDADAVARLIDGNTFSWVINAAAYTNVNRAEQEHAQALAVNRDGANNLARACNNAGTAMVHLSTDYVFDGKKPFAYVENDKIAPLNVYGESKVGGEIAVRDALDHHVIIRTAWLVSEHAPNFLTSILQQIRLGKELRVVSDQVGSLTIASDLAEAIAAIVNSIESDRREPVVPKWGTYHCTNAGEASWYEIARHIVAELGPAGRSAILVTPVTSDEYPSPVRRPQNSMLNCDRLFEQFGLCLRPWRPAATDLLRYIASVSPELVERNA